MNRHEKYFFVEGFYDELFFKAITESIFEDFHFRIIQYSMKRNEKVDNYILSLGAQHIPFLFIADEDPDHFNSRASRINEMTRRYPHLSEENIVLVAPK